MSNILNNIDVANNNKRNNLSMFLFLDVLLLWKIKFPMVNKATKRLHHPRFTTRRPHTYF